MSNTQNGVETRTTTTVELFEIITEKNHALRAFGALLKTARLSDFDSGECYKGTPGEQEAANLQWGLSMLLDLYLTDQEQALKNFADEYLESDDYLIESAYLFYGMFKEGAFIPGKGTLDRFRKVLKGLETVIARNSVLRPKAEDLKASMIKHVQPQQVRNIDQGGA